MAPRARHRKLQDPALLQKLEAELTAGEPLDAVLVRLSVSRSTIDREMKRDKSVRRRIVRALLVGRAQPKKAPPRAPKASNSKATEAETRTKARSAGKAAPSVAARPRRGAKSSAPSSPIAPVKAEPGKPPRRAAKSSAPPAPIAATTPAAPTRAGRRAAERRTPAPATADATRPAGAAPAEALPPATVAAVRNAAVVRPDASQSVAAGTGRVVFAVRRPHPLAAVRRITLQSERQRVVGRGTPHGGRLAVSDWLPVLLVLTADVGLAFAASGSLAVVAISVLVVGAYLILIRGLSHASLATVASSPPAKRATSGASPRVATPLPGTVPHDLAWLKGTIAEPGPGRRPARHARDRPGG